MITEAVLTWFLGLATFVLSAIPEWEAPTWLTDSGLTDAAGTLGSYAAGFSYWVPWTLIASVVATVVALYLVILGVRLALWVYSKIPVVGQ